MEEIESPRSEFVRAAKNPIHIKFSVVYEKWVLPEARFFFFSALKTKWATTAVEMWHKEKRIPVFAKIYRRKLLLKAQITPGTRPQRAVTAIVIIESR